MKNYRNQEGIISAIITIILLLIILVGVYFVLDLFGYIEVPDKYSISKYLEANNEDIYKAESLDVAAKKKKRKKTITKRDYNNIDGEFYLSNSVGNGYDDDNVSKNEVQDNSSINYEFFYYEQLDEYGKLIYNGVIDNIDNFKTGTYSINFGKAFNDLLHEDGGSDKLNESFQSAVNAVLLDNPDIFFLDITKLYLFTRSTTYSILGTTYEVSIGPNSGENCLNSYFTSTLIDEGEVKIDEIRKSVVANLDGDTIDQIRQVHDYLTENLNYDSSFSNSNIYNLYGALVNKSTVCEGYAKAFKYFMDEIEVPCVIVCGTAKNSKGDVENHAWNYVQLNGKWYAIDVTWDDPIIIGKGKLPDESKYKYFLRGADVLFQDHEENGNVVDGVLFEYPKLNKLDY